MEWTAPKSHSHERTQRWYIGGSVAVLAVAAYSILTANWSLVIPTVLIGGLYFMLRNEQQPLHTLRLEESGLQYDGVFCRWGDFDEAWFVMTPLGPELKIHRKKGTPRELKILVPEIGVTKVRTILSRFLKVGSDRKEHLFDLLIRVCKL